MGKLPYETMAINNLALEAKDLIERFRQACNLNSAKINTNQLIIRNINEAFDKIQKDVEWIKDHLGLEGEEDGKT